METNRLQRVNEEQPLNPRECLAGLLDQLDDNNLRQVLQIELKRVLGDHDRTINMLQHCHEILEADNEDLKTALNDIKRNGEQWGSSTNSNHHSFNKSPLNIQYV
ncbi:unnamed protein product [Absidia cylindrospora]